jgi:hypothetical protein
MRFFYKTLGMAYPLATRSMAISSDRLLPSTPPPTDQPVHGSFDAPPPPPRCLLLFRTRHDKVPESKGAMRRMTVNRARKYASRRGWSLPPLQSKYIAIHV